MLAAASNGQTEVCELLIEKGKTNSEETWLGRGCTALIQAGLGGHASTVALLLSKGARPDVRDQGYTPLLIAAQRGHTVVCELLLRKGKANIEDTTPDGSTALKLAAGEGFVSTVELLLSKGANVSTKDNKGFTPLLIAAKYGHAEVCELLLETGIANVKETWLGEGCTALIQSVLEGCCFLKASHKADIEETTPYGSTALKLAATEGFVSTVELLLSKGAKVDTKDNQGTPLCCLLLSLATLRLANCCWRPAKPM